MGKVSVILLVLAGVLFKFAGEDAPQPQYTDNENQNAMDFAQSLIMGKYPCDIVTMYSTENGTGRIDVRCDGKYQYEIVRHDGHWQVVSK